MARKFKHKFKEITDLKDKEKLYKDLQGIAGIALKEDDSEFNRDELVHSYWWWLMDNEDRFDETRTSREKFSWLCTSMRRFYLKQIYEERRRIKHMGVYVGRIPYNVGVHTKYTDNAGSWIQQTSGDCQEERTEHNYIQKDEYSSIDAKIDEMDYPIERKVQRLRIRREFRSVTKTKSDKFWAVLKLYFEGLSIDQIAKRMNVDKGAVHQAIHRKVKVIRDRKGMPRIRQNTIFERSSNK